jgi:hypothetical protein
MKAALFCDGLVPQQNAHSFGYTMGRRLVDTDKALLRLAGERDWWYHHPEHRHHPGDLIRRSRYFLVPEAAYRLGSARQGSATVTRSPARGSYRRHKGCAALRGRYCRMFVPWN